MDDFTQKAIDAVFEIMADKEKARKLDDLQQRLGMGSDFFSFSSLLGFNEDRLVNLLDWFFYPITGMYPDGDIGGTITYTLYDAAVPSLDGIPYNLKEKGEFEDYIQACLKRRETNEDE